MLPFLELEMHLEALDPRRCLFKHFLPGPHL